jgi:hypothetical protein
MLGRSRVPMFFDPFRASPTSQVIDLPQVRHCACASDHPIFFKLGRHRSPVDLGDAPHHRQPQAGAGGPGGEERGEDALRELRRNPEPVGARPMKWALPPATPARHCPAKRTRTTSRPLRKFLPERVDDRHPGDGDLPLPWTGCSTPATPSCFRPTPRPSVPSASKSVGPRLRVARISGRAELRASSARAAARAISRSPSYACSTLKLETAQREV